MKETRACKSGRFMVIGILLLSTTLWGIADAADVSINYNMQQQSTAAIVAPRNATKAVTTPVFTNIQSTTELETTKAVAMAPDQSEETVSSATATRSRPTLPKAYIGIDTYFSDHENIYNIPIGYSFFTDVYTQLNIPIVSAKYDMDGSSIDNTGIGDVSLTLKHIWGTEDIVEIYSLGTVSFATGDEDKGLGSGAYVISLTEKAVKRFGEYRCTVMGGVNVPLNDPTILGSKVEYSTSLSYMAAVERSFFLPSLWFGVRAAGIHVSESKIDGTGARNALTTLDIIPGVRYAASYRTALQLAVFVPVHTAYDVPGASSRDVVVNFGIVKSF